MAHTMDPMLKSRFMEIFTYIRALEPIAFTAKAILLQQQLLNIASEVILTVEFTQNYIFQRLNMGHHAVGIGISAARVQYSLNWNPAYTSNVYRIMMTVIV